MSTSLVDGILSSPLHGALNLLCLVQVYLVYLDLYFVSDSMIMLCTAVTCWDIANPYS